MSTIIREGNGISLARQVSLSLRQKIRTKEYRHGTPLPSIRMLKDEYGVTLNVIQRALRELENEGVVQAHHGKGVVVVNEDPAQRTAITFGFIYPYSHMAFSQDVLYYAERVFRDRHNLLVAVSSEESSQRERETAQHLIHNGVQALIVWPCEKSDNGAFFNELSQQIPIVLVDRLLDGADLPAIILDTYQMGKDVIHYFFKELKRQRLLMVMDDLEISPYKDFTRGAFDAAKVLKRQRDLTLLPMPLSKIVQSLALTNPAGAPLLEQTAENISQTLQKGKFDALFCYQNDFIDYGLIDSGIMKQFPTLCLGTTGGETTLLSRRYFQTEGALWLFDQATLISMAADKIQQWILSRQAYTDVILLPVQCLYFKPGAKKREQLKVLSGE